MNTQERQIIDDLFDKLRQVEQQAGPREPNAETHIRSRIERQPGAPYWHADDRDAGAGAAERPGAHRRA